MRVGRILNPKAARSQVIGGMTMGVGAALMEDLVVDKRRGFFVNHDLAGYEVPVHAGIPSSTKPTRSRHQLRPRAWASWGFAAWARRWRRDGWCGCGIIR